jgi:DNA-binding response OmpR family regulator
MGVFVRPDRTMRHCADNASGGFGKAKPDAEGPASKQRKARVLIVDDDSTICSALARLVQKAGHQPSYAYDGQEALDALKRQEADLIISDKDMPRMGGMELLVESKSRFPGTRFMLMSAKMSNEEAQRAFELGADGVVQKPFNNIFMAELIRGLLRKGCDNNGPSVEKKALKVLVVDDDDMTLSVNEAMMRRMGHEVTTAEDGRQALGAFMKEGFDLVLTDRQMPHMGGLELLVEIRKVDKDVPVIVVSGNVSSPQRDELYSLGADLVLQKPFGFDELKAAMERWEGR